LSFYADGQVGCFFRNLGQLLHLVAHLVLDGECGFGVLRWSLVFLWILHGVDQNANDFFDVVEEQPGGWEVAGNLRFFCSDRQVRIYISPGGVVSTCRPSAWCGGVRLEA